MHFGALLGGWLGFWCSFGWFFPLCLVLFLFCQRIRTLVFFFLLSCILVERRLLFYGFLCCTLFPPFAGYVHLARTLPNKICRFKKKKYCSIVFSIFRFRCKSGSSSCYSSFLFIVIHLCKSFP